MSRDTLTDTHRRLLLSLPEHLVDDIMTLLLFVARTSSAMLRSAPLDAALTLILFFLRRPWAGLCMYVCMYVCAAIMSRQTVMHNDHSVGCAFLKIIEEWYDN